MDDLESEQQVVTRPLEENPIVAELLRLLSQTKVEQLTDLKELVQCVSTMETQFTKTTAELQTVKQELQALRGQLSGEEKTLFSDLTESLDTALRQGREQLSGIRMNIVRASRVAVYNLKGKGISGLNHALEVLGVRKAVSTLQTHLNKTSKSLETGIERVETVGRELREAGKHLQNAGCVLTGKERQGTSDQAGRATAAILSLMRRIHDAIKRIESLSGRALNRLDSLERAAKEERPSVKDTLKTLKNQRTQPGKARKRQEPVR